MRESFPFAHPVHRLTYPLRRLDILSQTEDSLWFRFSTFFRVDPCLRLLEELEDVKQRAHRMTVCGFASKIESTSFAPQDVWLIILGAYNARQADAANAEMLGPQTREAGAPTGSGGAFSNGTATGSSTSNLRHRITTAAGPISNGDASGSEAHISSTSISSPPPSLESFKRKADLLNNTIWILGSDFLRLQLLEPIVGDALMSYPSIIDDYGVKGQSIYTAFFDHLDMKTFVCWECGHTVEGDLEVAIVHQRAVHFQHEPYRCNALNGEWRVLALISGQPDVSLIDSEHRFASQSMLHAHQVSAGH